MGYSARRGFTNGSMKMTGAQRQAEMQARIQQMQCGTRGSRRDQVLLSLPQNRRKHGFSPVSFFHVLHGYVVHFGSNSGFFHPVLPVLNCSHPLQHPKRTRFRLFLAESGAFSSFLLFFWCKISALVFVHPAA